MQKNKLNVKQLLANELKLLSSKNVNPEDPVYEEKVNKLAEQVNVYNQIMKDAQNEIRLKEVALKEIDGIDIDDTHDRKMNVSTMNRENLLKELEIQTKKVSNAESQRKKKESILKEIEVKNKEVSHAKKQKLNVKQLLANELKLLSSNNVNPEDPVYEEKVNKLAEQVS